MKFQAFSHILGPYSARVQASMYRNGAMPIVDTTRSTIVATVVAKCFCSK